MPRIANPRELGALARERRHELDLTQQEVATRVGVSRRWVATVEAGAPRSELRLVLRLLGVLGLELWVGDPAPAPGSSVNRLDLDAVLQRTLLDG